MARRPASQPDLLDWAPPEPVVRFDPRTVRGATLGAKIAKAVSQAMADHEGSREQIAVAMGKFLGQDVRPSLLNSYASESRDDVINVVRFMALIAVTGDRRLLELLAGEMGWAVIERRYLTLINLAAVQERQSELRGHADALRRAAKAEGTL